MVQVQNQDILPSTPSNLIEDAKDAIKAWQGLIGLGFIALVLACALLARCAPPAQPSHVPALATVNPEVKNESLSDIAIATPKHTVKAYTAKAKARLTLPAAVAADDGLAVTSSSLLPSSENGQIHTTVLDVRTGNTESYVTKAPAPWLALEDRGQISLDYGFKRNSTAPVARINLRADVLQIKQVHVGASASLYSDGDYFAGVGMSYRW
jgi:hypothetical protein